MSFSTENKRDDYIGNGSTNVYGYTFKLLDEDHLSVTVRDTDDVETPLTIGIDYIVDGVGDPGGGNITLVDNDQAWLDGSGNLDTGFALTLLRDVPLTQESDFRDLGTYFPEQHENAHDRSVMQMLTLKDEVERSLKLNVTDFPSGDLTLPQQADRAGNFLAFDLSGNPIASSGTTGGVVVSAFMETLVDDPDAQTGRETLGFNGVGGTVQATNIEDLAVTTNKLDNLAVTAAKIAADAVITAKILDANVTKAKLATGAKDLNVVTVNFGMSPYTVALTDEVILVDTSGGSVTLDWFSAVGTSGRRVVVKKITNDVNTVTVDPNGAQTINGGSTKVMYGYNESWDIVPDGTNLHVIDQTHQYQTMRFNYSVASGADGGTMTTSYTDATINTTTNPFNYGWASLAADTVTLDAGNYIVSFAGVGFRVNGFRYKIRNFTDSTDLVLGTNGSSDAGGDGHSNSLATDVPFTISASKGFKLQHRAGTANAGDGQGGGLGFGDNEQFGFMTFTRIQ